MTFEAKEQMFYIRDARQVVGNCALWWAVDSKGYTTELNRAGKYTAQFCSDLRDTDIPLPVELVDSIAVTHVRLDTLRDKGGR